MKYETYSFTGVGLSDFTYLSGIDQAGQLLCPGIIHASLHILLAVWKEHPTACSGPPGQGLLDLLPSLLAATIQDDAHILSGSNV